MERPRGVYSVLYGMLLPLSSLGFVSLPSPPPEFSTCFILPSVEFSLSPNIGSRYSEFCTSADSRKTARCTTKLPAVFGMSPRKNPHNTYLNRTDIEENAFNQRQKKREAEEADKFEVAPGVTVASLRGFRTALIGPTQGLPKRRRLCR